MLFLSTNEFQILKTTKETYSILFKNPSKTLINSLTKSRLILGATITDNYTSLNFKALSLETLTQFQKKHFKHDDGLRMTISLTKQLSYLLQNTSECFFTYETNKILVIDEEIFVYLSNEFLVNREKQNIIITTPFLKEGFLSPELLELKYIPAKIHYKTIYYSLGSLLVFCLSGQTITSITNIETQNIEEILTAVKSTKLYYFLLRSLDKDLLKRSLIYV
jgi:hypothetical protein